MTVFGPIQGLLEAHADAVPATLYRATRTRKASGWQGGTPAAVASPSVLLGEISEDDAFREFGVESDARYVGAVQAGTGARRGDELKVSTSAHHHAGRTFVVRAARDPGGRYERLLLEAVERKDPED